jgi:hypothetical protein
MKHEIKKGRVAVRDNAPLLDENEPAHFVLEIDCSERVAVILTPRQARKIARQLIVQAAITEGEFLVVEEESAFAWHKVPYFTRPRKSAPQ